MPILQVQDFQSVKEHRVLDDSNQGIVVHSHPIYTSPSLDNDVEIPLDTYISILLLQ